MTEERTPYHVDPVDALESDPRPLVEAMIAQAHAHRQGESYPTAERLLANLPEVLRGVCDFALSDRASGVDIARALASIIDAIEHVDRSGNSGN